MVLMHSYLFLRRLESLIKKVVKSYKKKGASNFHWVNCATGFGTFLGSAHLSISILLLIISLFRSFTFLYAESLRNKREGSEKIQNYRLWVNMHEIESKIKPFRFSFLIYLLPIVSCQNHWEIEYKFYWDEILFKVYRNYLTEKIFIAVIFIIEGGTHIHMSGVNASHNLQQQQKESNLSWTILRTSWKCTGVIISLETLVCVWADIGHDLYTQKHITMKLQLPFDFKLERALRLWGSSEWFEKQ